MHEKSKLMSECLLVRLDTGLRRVDPWHVSVVTRSRPWEFWSTHQTVFVGDYAGALAYYNHLVGEE